MSKINNSLHASVIIAGGGTGGHIFPALAIARQLQADNPYVKILFIGSKHRMEMQKIPEAGYEIRGLDIYGIARKNWWKNIFLIFKLLKSFVVVHKILREFKPNVVIGVGGYSSFPVLFIAQFLKIPTLIQEQNSYAGIANRILGKDASVVCLGYKEAARFFPKATTVYTGNPLRSDLLKFINNLPAQNLNLHQSFGLSPAKPIVLILGGSLGSGALNNFVLQHLEDWQKNGIQLIWQCGAGHYRRMSSMLQNNSEIYITDFLEDIRYAYQVADIVISRAGALAIAEIAALKKPAIFVPLANSTGNHQFYNAQSLQKIGAALLIQERDLPTQLFPKIMELLANPALCAQMSAKISEIRQLQATNLIVNEIFRLIDRSSPPLTKVYMLGIGGAGMQALARYLHKHGVDVAGYDQQKSRYTLSLKNLGIRVDYQEDPRKITSDLDWIIYTPALSANSSPLLKYCQTQGIPLLKRSFVLGLLSRNARNICVSGTHGKTSTCALFATIARASYYKVHEFIGGEQILFTHAAQGGDKIENHSIEDLNNGYELNIIEADEYDKSFLTLNPYLLVITSMDIDHLEVYGSEASLYSTYYDLVTKLSPSGVLILPYSLMQKHNFPAKNIVTYSIEDTHATIFAKDILYKSDHSVEFDVFINNVLYSHICLPKATDFNVENSLAAIMLAYILNIPENIVQNSLKAYTGVRRRFELLYEDEKLNYIQDYAHHPRELEQSVRALRKRYPGKRLLLIFQPHLFSRTQYFYREFAHALDIADEIILLPIYPARELPIDGVDSGLIGSEMRKNWRVLEVENCLEWIKANLDNWEVVMSVGAGGDLERISDEVLSWLKLRL